jgi:hypothetical protein
MKDGAVIPRFHAKSLLVEAHSAKVDAGFA